MYMLSLIRITWHYKETDTKALPGITLRKKKKEYSGKQICLKGP